MKVRSPYHGGMVEGTPVSVANVLVLLDGKHCIAIDPDTLVPRKLETVNDPMLQERAVLAVLTARITEACKWVRGRLPTLADATAYAAMCEVHGTMIVETAVAAVDRPVEVIAASWTAVPDNTVLPEEDEMVPEPVTERSRASPRRVGPSRRSRPASRIDFRRKYEGVQDPELLQQILEADDSALADYGALLIAGTSIRHLTPPVIRGLARLAFAGG